MIASGTVRTWMGALVFIGIVYRMIQAAREEDRRRIEEGEPHTTGDTLLLLGSGILIVGVASVAIVYTVDHDGPKWIGNVIGLAAPAAAVGIYLVHRRFRRKRKTQPLP